MERMELWIERARGLVGAAHILTESSDVEPYGHDEYALVEYAQRPAAVARPGTEEEAAALVRLCAELKVPLTARGGGTGLAAGCVPSPGGIVLSLERLNKLIEADQANHTITVQAGMKLHDLYQEVAKMRLYFPPHPGDEGAFIGGAVAANAGGARAVKYGTVKRYVLGLQVILADGRIVDLGGKYIKTSTGYGLLELMIGSEGTLGVITRVTLALVPPPGSVKTMIVPFATVSDAIAMVPAVLAADIVPSAVEFVEHTVLRCAERLLQRHWPAQSGAASLMFILDGRTEEDVLAQAEAIGGVAEQAGGLDVLLAEDKTRQAEMLEMRSVLYEALRPGTVELFDICVPRAEIAGHVRYVHDLEARYGVTLPTYGHAIDGNVHTHSLRRRLTDGLIGDELPGWRETHAAVKRDLFADAVRRGGVISGEHGIGLAKRDYLKATLGETKVELMARIKHALDPENLLNPGKIFGA
jgi:glycolate oxidase